VYLKLKITPVSTHFRSLKSWLNCGIKLVNFMIFFLREREREKERERERPILDVCNYEIM